MMYRRSLVPAALLLAACGGDTTGPPQPTPGTLTVTLAAPAGAVPGAVVLTLTGPGAITSVAGVGGSYRVYSRALAAGDGVKAAVFGTLAPGAVLRFHVPDTGDADEYAATLVEVAGVDNAVEPTAGYGLTIRE